MAGAFVLLALTGALALNVSGRALGVSLVGANLFAAWLLPVLAFVALPTLVPRNVGMAGTLACLVSGFAIGALGVGMVGAALRIGGTEAVLAIPVPMRYGLGAAACAFALLAAPLGAGWRGAVVLAGAALSMLPLPALPPVAALAAFIVALLVRTPVALALLAAVALSPGPLSDAALAQNIMRGLSGYVLLAVPLFILAAALMVAGGIGERIVAAVRLLARGRPSALGEANVLASLLFGGVSASSIADAAMAARLLVPGMVSAGYPPGRAAALSASAAVLPNVMPPSIALLLAAAATDLSVGALWFAGLFAAPVLAAVLLFAVRLTAPPATGAPEPGPGSARAALFGLVPAVAIAASVLGALRFGLVTAVEAGLVAVLFAAGFALQARGARALAHAVVEAAGQAGRVAILIAAAAPVGFLLASRGVSFAELLPAGPAALTLGAALLACLVLGTALDAGAAILLVLPLLVPAVAAAGLDPVHAALTLTLALLLGGLTPPVGILILVVKEVTGASGVYTAVLPYLLAMILALVLVAAGPALLDTLAAALAGLGAS